MNADQTLLQSLHDIHLPAAIGLWPLAPGWYGLIGLVLVSVVAGILLGWRWLRRGQIKREALRLIAEIEKIYQAQPQSQLTSAALNELLKRVALAYFPRDRVAGLHGKDWLNFLQATSKQLDFSAQGEALICGPYQPTQLQDLGPVFVLARRWIAQRERPCSF